MAISKIAAIFDWDIKQVWDAVTDLHDWKWRSDLKGLEVRGAAHFTEYSKDGYRTDFTVTKKIPCERWEFELENEQMRGRWTGVFIKEGERTRVVFTEDITAKKLILKPILKIYLKRQQERYITDLRKRLAQQTR
jgi:hypothetical protein